MQYLSGEGADPSPLKRLKYGRKIVSELEQILSLHAYPFQPTLSYTSSLV